jgi:hypothetical protein
LDNHDPDEQAYRRAQREQARERRRLKEERTALLEDRLYDVAMGTVTDATAVQIQAGRAVHAMWNGMPTQKTELNASIRRSVEELSDDELLALAGSGESPSGTGEEGDGAE